MKSSLLVLSTVLMIGGCASRTHNEVSATMGAGGSVTITPGGGSYVRFIVDASAYKVDANFEKFSGTLGMGDDGVNSVNFEVDVTSVKTKAFDAKFTLPDHDSKRDAALCGGQFFACGQHPKATFVSTKVVKTSSGQTLQGNLTIKGKTKLIVMKVKEEGGFYIGKASVDRQDFGLTGDAPGYLKAAAGSAGASVVISDAVDLEVKVPKN